MAEFITGANIELPVEKEKQPPATETFDIKLTLTRAEFDTLTMMLGMATGGAFRNGADRLAYAFLKLANTIHKDNKKWRPYEIPPEYQDGTKAENDQDVKGH